MDMRGRADHQEERVHRLTIGRFHLEWLTEVAESYEGSWHRQQDRPARVRKRDPVTHRRASHAFACQEEFEQVVQSEGPRNRQPLER